ncbi:MnhB domain-containing protein [Flindersiella endophytica]
MRARLVLFGIGALGLLALLAIGFTGLPEFGSQSHPYGDRAVAAAEQQHTANAVASVTFDQRSYDTLGEEFMLFTAALGAVVLLRRVRHEEEEDGWQHTYGPAEVFDAVRLVGLVLLPVTVVAGAYVILHGHVSPGGGFQGGVVLATGLLLLYLAGDYRALEAMRPVPVFEVGEAIGAAGYVVVGLLGLTTGGAFLLNVLPLGRFGSLGSSGIVLALNITVGVEVASAMMLMAAKFLEQALLIREEG